MGKRSRSDSSDSSSSSDERERRKRKKEKRQKEKHKKEKKKKEKKHKRKHSEKRSTPSEGNATIPSRVDAAITARVEATMAARAGSALPARVDSSLPARVDSALPARVDTFPEPECEPEAGAKRVMGAMRPEQHAAAVSASQRVERVYDPGLGVYRCVRLSGEVVEESVSKTERRHLAHVKARHVGAAAGSGEEAHSYTGRDKFPSQHPWHGYK
jgi:hypothetical protein